MAGRYRYRKHGAAASGKVPGKAPARVIAGFALAISFSGLIEATSQWCSVLGKSAWLVPTVLRPAMQFASWQAACPYLSEGSRFVQLLLQIGACVWPLIGALAGRS